MEELENDSASCLRWRRLKRSPHKGGWRASQRTATRLGPGHPRPAADLRVEAQVIGAPNAPTADRKRPRPRRQRRPPPQWPGRNLAAAKPEAALSSASLALQSRVRERCSGSRYYTTCTPIQPKALFRRPAGARAHDLVLRLTAMAALIRARRANDRARASWRNATVASTTRASL